MKLTVHKPDLARVMTNVGRVVEARTTVPILSSVLLTASAGRLSVAGTDLDILATASAEAEVTTPGAICVDAKLLSDIVKKAGQDTIDMSLDGDKLIVKSGRSRFTLATLPGGDFPSFADGSYSNTFSIDIAALFAPVSFAISTEETRFYLNGVFLVGANAKITAVATDGHRLARLAIDATEVFAGIIVPRKVCGILPKGTVTVSVSEQKIRIAAGDFTLVSKLIDGTFPDYERVIPKTNDKIVTVDRDTMMKATDRVASISSERGRAVKLTIAPDSIALSARSDVGQAEDEVAAEYSGEPLEIGFNSIYLRDLLTVLPSGPVLIALADGGSPAVITSPAFDGLTLIAMPTRV